MDNVLQNVNEQAAANASNGLSKLIDRQVRVEATKTKVKKLEDLSPFSDPEELVAGVYLPVTGDISGGTLLVLPKDSAFVLSDLLVKREPGTTRTLTKLDISALKEVGNIICGNYLAVLANVLQIRLIEHVPDFSLEMFGAMLSQIVANFAREVDRALVVEIEFTIKPETLRGYLLLLLQVEQLEAVLGSLVGAGGEAS